MGWDRMDLRTCLEPAADAYTNASLIATSVGMRSGRVRPSS